MALEGRYRVQQGDEDVQRHPRDQHHRHQHRPHHVAGDHDFPARESIGHPGQEQCAYQIGQGSRRVGDRGEQRRPGPVVDQERQGYESQAVAACREDLGEPEGSELANREDIAKGCTLCRGTAHGDPLLRSG